MKLLLDENLSRRLIPALQDLFPGSTHVTQVGLERTADLIVWAYAKANQFIILTKDDDFTDLLTLHGPPPKIVLLKIGNSANSAILAAISAQYELICAELNKSTVGLVAVY